jgi:hypothetical protein
MHQVENASPVKQIAYNAHLQVIYAQPAVVDTIYKMEDVYKTKEIASPINQTKPMDVKCASMVSS